MDREPGRRDRGPGAAVEPALRFESGPRRGEVLPVGEQPVVFGRDRACDVRLDDDKVSRRHAQVSRDDDGRLVVEDLGSANGTWVDGERLSGPRPLPPGSQVRIGSTVLSAPGRRKRHARLAAATVTAAAAIALAAALLVNAGDDTDRPPAASPVDMERLNRGTVRVITRVRDRPSNFGSGWVYDADAGLVVTNAHVLHLQRRAGALSVSVDPGDGRRRAELVAIAPCEDLAVLRTRPGGLTGLPMAPAGSVKPGDTVVAAGFPYVGTAARNVVATQTEVVRAGGPTAGPHGDSVVPLPDALELAVPLRGGESGGPVVDEKTRVVGVIAVGNTVRRERRTSAIATARMRDVLAFLRRGESRGWLGAALQPGPGGLALTATLSGGGADRAGLAGRPWILDTIDGRRVSDDIGSYCRAIEAAARAPRARIGVRPAVPSDEEGYAAAPGARRRGVDVSLR